MFHSTRIAEADYTMQYLATPELSRVVTLSATVVYTHAHMLYRAHNL